MFLANLLLRPTIVPREEWKAEKAAKEIPTLKPEVEHVVVTFTDSPSCSSKQECAEVVKKLQSKQVKYEGEPDIFYNFLIGGDGNVYEGRGWKLAPRPYPKNNKKLEPLQGNAIEVAFIGYQGEKPTMKMLKAFGGLVIKAVKEKVLVNDMKRIKPCFIINGEPIFLKDELMKENGETMDKNQLLQKLGKMT